MSDREAEDTAAIALHGAVATDRNPDSEITEQLGRRLDQIELLVEHVGQSAALTVELTEYIKDLRSEIKSLRMIRALVLFGSTSLGAVLLAFSSYVILWRPLLFYSFGPAARVALITSSTAGSVLLATIVLKGVFRTLAERNTEELMPANLQTMIEAVKSFRSN